MHFGSLMLDRPHAKRCEAKNDIDCELRTHVKLASFRRHQSSSTVCIPAEPTSFCSGGGTQSIGRSSTGRRPAAGSKTPPRDDARGNRRTSFVAAVPPWSEIKVTVQVRGPARRCSGSGARGTVHGRVGSGSGAGQLARPYETVKSMNSKGRDTVPTHRHSAGKHRLGAQTSSHNPPSECDTLQCVISRYCRASRRCTIGT